jgi:Zn-dependent protease with chaperone function
VLAVILGIGVGFGYLVLVAGRIPIKLVVLVGVFVVYSLWAILKSLFVRPRDEDPGTPLDLSEHPRLQEALREVARTVGTRPVDRVFVTPGTTVAVLERGSALSRLRGKAVERCLVLGIGTLQGMRLLDFKAVLAHEYGHFQNEDTAGGGFALAVRRSLLLSAMAMAQSGVATWYNPAWWFVRGFFNLFLRISQGASRLQEVLADRWAAFSYGAAAFEGGLRHAIVAQVQFDARSTAILNEVLQEKRGLRNLYSYQPAKPADLSEIEREIEEALEKPASPYDSHPSPAERFALVKRLADAPKPVDDGALAMSLFDDPDSIEREMTREVKGRVLEQVGVKIPDEDPARAEDAEEEDHEEDDDEADDTETDKK